MKNQHLLPEGSRSKTAGLVAWRSGNAFHPINKVTVCCAQWLPAGR